MTQVNHYTTLKACQCAMVDWKSPSIWDAVYQKITAIWTRLIGQFITHMMQATLLREQNFTKEIDTFGGLYKPFIGLLQKNNQKTTTAAFVSFNSMLLPDDDTCSTDGETDGHLRWTPSEESDTDSIATPLV